MNQIEKDTPSLPYQDTPQPSVTILVVEDDISLLDGISDLLKIAIKDYPIEVLPASNGVDGLIQLATKTPSLIISDVMMPKMDGYEFLDKVRQNPNWVHIPFIFLTAKGERSEISRGRQSGAELYIVKPFMPAQFTEIVKTQIDRSIELQKIRQQDLDKLKQNIIWVLNHEFRTPLSYVTAYSEMLVQDYDWNTLKYLQDYLVGVQAGCLRMRQLVENLITIIELRTGEMSLKFSQECHPINNISNLWQKVGQKQAAHAKSHNISIRYQIPSNLPPIYSTEKFIAAIGHQLVDNAIKFTTYRKDNLGTITLKAAFDDDNVYLSVIDNGIGLPPTALKIIFDLFVQYNRDTYEQQGTGAGLTIVQELTKLHGGTIKVDSAEHQGSTFTIVLPRLLESIPNTKNNETKIRPVANILVVEDDFGLRTGICELLELTQNHPYQFHTTPARNGQEALDLMETIKPDLILSDIMMPVMNGYKFLKQVRQNPSWIQIPILFLTAKGDEQDIHEGRKLGVEEYITKPFDNNELVALIVARLKRYHVVKNRLEHDFASFKNKILDLLQPDFRNPLQDVASFSNEVSQSLTIAETDEDLKKSLYGLRNASWQLSKHVEDFITLAEIQTREVEAAFSYRAGILEKPHTFFYEAAQKFKSHHTNTTTEFLTDNIYPVKPIWADIETLHRAIDRLFLISTKLLPNTNKQHIILGCHQDQDMIYFTIQNTNIPAATKEITQLKQILAEPTNKQILSTTKYGTALAVAKELIHLHNGHIIINTNPQEVLVLEVTIPIMKGLKLTNPSQRKTQLDINI